MHGLGPVPLRLRGGLDEIMARQVREAALLAAEQTLRRIGPPQSPDATAADTAATMVGATANCGEDNVSEWRDAPQLVQDDCDDAVHRQSPMLLPRGVKWCDRLICCPAPRRGEQRAVVSTASIYSARLPSSRPRS